MAETDSMDDTECELLSMLLGPYSEDEEMRSKAEEVWEWVDTVFDQLVETHPMKNTMRYTNSSRAAKPQLLVLLANYLYSHRWLDAARIVTRLISEPNGTAHIAHHVGMELVQQDRSQELASLMERLMKQLKVLLDLNTKNLGLDYFLCLFKQGMLNEARDVLRNYHVRSVVGSRPFLGKSRQDDFVSEVLYKGYEGLSFYVEWLQLSNEVPCDSEASHVNTEQDPKQLAETAVKCFTGLENTPNHLDIFIQPYLHLLQYLGSEVSAVEVATSYCKTNPDNANAWRLLLQCNLLDDDLKREALINLCRLLPCEPTWVLKNRHLLKAECVKILLECLDYPENQQNSQLWRALAEDLLQTGLTQDVRDLWEQRVDWWPDLHFSDAQVIEDTAQLSTEALEDCLRNDELSANASELISCKASVAHLLCGSDNGYTARVVLIGRLLNESEDGGWRLLHQALMTDAIL